MRGMEHFGADGGRKYQVGRMTILFKTPRDGAFSLVEAIEPPGSGASLHRHPSYQETFDFAAIAKQHGLEFLK